MFSCNVVSRWAQLVSFLNCLQDVKLSRIAIYRDEFRRMNCSLNWSFISCGELHCDSVKIKTVINSRPIQSNKTEQKTIEPNRTPIVRLGWAIEQNRTPILLWVRFSNQSNQYNQTKSNKIELIRDFRLKVAKRLEKSLVKTRPFSP